MYENPQEKNMAKEVDLEKLELEELKRLAKDIEKAMKKREADNLKKAREAAEAAAREYGYSLDEVLGTKAPRRTVGGSSDAKFRHPENPALTWSGRGRQPQWFKDAIASGKTPEDLSV
jgi:DNA-binding protein H-NS